MKKKKVKNILNKPNSIEGIELKKNSVLVLPCDFSACGYIRLLDQIRVLTTHYTDQNFLPIISPRPIFDNSILETVRTIIVQRCYTSSMLKVISKYYELKSKYNYKIVYDIDDMLFNFDKWQCPRYLPVFDLYGSGKAGNIASEIISMCDAVNVSTIPLKNCIKDLGYKGQINLVENKIPIYLYGSQRKGFLLKDLDKPTVLYAGSKSHYIKNNSGDFTENWLNFIKMNVLSDKISFVWIGEVPDFFEDIKDKMIIYPGVNIMDFPRILREIQADFQIGPLAENWFTACKSDIKALQSYATDSIFIGTKFKSIPSPYDNCKNYININDSTEEINKVFWNLTKVTNYNESIKWQRNYLFENHCYMEDQQSQLTFIKSLC